MKTDKKTDNLKDCPLNELFKEYVAQSDRINSGSFGGKDYIEEFGKLENLGNELLRRGVPLAPWRKETKWTDSHYDESIRY